MRYLADLVKSLNEAEKDAVLQWPLRGKERELLEWVWQHRYEKAVHDAGAVCTAVNITRNTLFKINSLLCDKVYETMVPGRGEALIAWLPKRHLVPHLYHEMKQQEKKTLQGVSENDKVGFLTACFEASQTVPVKYYEEKRARYYARRLSAAANDQQTDVYINARLLSTTIYVQSAGIAGKLKSTGQLQKQFSKVQALINQSSRPCLKGKLFLYRAYSLYYIDVERDMPLALNYIERCMALFNEPGHPFTTEERIIISCRLADTLYGNSQFEEAQQRYGRIFHKYDKHSALVNEVYHHNKWVQLALINGDMLLASNVLNEHFLPYIIGKHQSILTMASISFAKYHLLNNEPEKALDYINSAMSFNKKDLYVQYEMELRYLHNTYFALMGDIDFALNLAKKNLRHLRSKGLTEQVSDYGYFYHLMMAFINRKELTDLQEEKLQIYNTGYYAIYGRLLLSVADKYKQRKRIK